MVVDVRRIGYMPSRLGFAAGGDTTVSVFVLPSAQEVPAVQVTGAGTRSLALAGFEQRMLERKRGSGTGRFITAAEIEASPPLRATQIVENVPSILVRRVDGDRSAIMGKGTGGGAECPATVYLDGVHIPGSGEAVRDRRGRLVGVRDYGAPIDQLVDPSDVVGVEVYARGVFAPPQFRPPGDEKAVGCAVVAFWTRRAR